MERMAYSQAQFPIERRLHDAVSGDADACHELGIVYSSGVGGVAVDLIEAHKWFNIAAASGHCHAVQFRAEVAEEMTAREIVAAQKLARAWLRGGNKIQ